MMPPSEMNPSGSRPGETRVSLVVQAGGRSSRMGRDKGLVSLAGRPLVQHVIDRLGILADEVVITTNDPGAYRPLGFRTASDAEPGAGALAGLLTALGAAAGDPVLVAACDMPFASPRLAAQMLRWTPPAEAVVPRLDGEFEPLFAVYRRACIPAIERALQRGDRRVISFFGDVSLRTVDETDVRRIEPDPWCFFNVNTEADLAEAERHLATV
jgi:molybdopterin-guanine dinucleotide biosynthesis protein A